MRIAIVHHHLRPGGVTRVIENAVASLADRHDIVVLTGESCPGGSPLASRTVTVDGLAYQSASDGLTPQALAGRLRRAAGDVDLWHVHNHSLGKNAALPDGIALLADAGARMLLQIHDFAEDGRPSNYAVASRAANLYPHSRGIHYAVLTGRDRSILAYAGVAEPRLHLLPNPVAIPVLGSEAMPGGVPAGRRILFYPTRGIRRKNIGEAVLLAAVLKDEGIRVATSRVPDNPVWLDVHRGWERLARECGLPMALGVVDNPDHGGHSFGSWLAAAHAILTTSISEGFGLAFLEPLLADKALVGRDLPEVTTDFQRAGLSFPGLYRALLVPEGWVDAEELRSRLGELLGTHYASYGAKPPRNAESRALEAMKPREGWFDFGCLEEPVQAAIIRRVANAPDAVREIRLLTDAPEPAAVAPWLRKRMDMGGRLNAQTRTVLDRHYSLASYGERLNLCYQRVRTGDELPRFNVNREAILNVFLAPERFHMLKTG